MFVHGLESVCVIEYGVDGALQFCGFVFGHVHQWQSAVAFCVCVLKQIERIQAFFVHLCLDKSEPSLRVGLVCFDRLLEVVDCFRVLVVAELEVAFVGESVRIVVLDVDALGGVENVTAGNTQADSQGCRPQKFGFKYVFHYTIPIYLKR